jgi:hypothetical protein
MRKTVVATSVGILTMFAVSACGTGTNTTANPSTAPTQSKTNQVKAVSVPHAYQLDMKIVTGKMDGKPGWPKFEPANAVLPTNSVVHVTIKDYDDGPAAIPKGDNLVKGTVGGTMTVDGKTVTSIPAGNVAHTLTISSMGLNIPIPPKTAGETYALVTFSFKTPVAPEKLNWQCMAACGTGSSGWQGPMQMNGWMKGVFDVK